MATIRCSVIDEGLSAPDEGLFAQCTTPATMVRTVISEGEFPTCSYYCAEHGDAHGAMVIEVAQQIRTLRERALKQTNEHLINACDKALLGDELAIDECMEAIAETREEAAR